jgi:hypothetical protein
MGHPIADTKERAETIEEVVEENENENDPQDDTDTDTDTEVIRAKCMWDGCRTLAEVIERLRDQEHVMQRLMDDGYELTQPVNDDYGFIRKNN